MYSVKVDNGRISLGRILDRLQRVVSEDLLSKRENIVFMPIRVETGEGSYDFAAVMMSSYTSYLDSGFERVIRGNYGGRLVEEARREVRFFKAQFESSLLRSANRAHIPRPVRNHAGIPLYGSVFVVKRNGYAVISPNPSVAKLEAEPWDARATTIDQVVAAIVKEEREAAFSCQYQ